MVMAEVLGAYSFTIQDELGIKASARIPVLFDNTKTLAQLATGLIAYGDVVDAAVGGAIIEARIETFLAPSVDWKASPVAGSRVEQTGLFNFKPTGVTHRFGIDLPSIADSVLSAGRILLGSGAAQDFIDLVLAGVSADGVESANPAGQVLAVFTDALVSFRKHRRALDRRTFETP